MSLSSLNIAIVIAYAFGLIAVATLVSREKGDRKKDTADYFLAGKSLP